MLHLIQLFNFVEDKDLFIALFSNLKDEAIALGYDQCITDLVNEMLYNHFDIEIDDQNQLIKITNAILKHNDLTILRNISI